MLGYSVVNLVNNTKADYEPGESFFTVFGVFFPTATGVMAGINMSGDLRNPAKNIPLGTLSSIGVRYVGFVIVIFKREGPLSVKYNVKENMIKFDIFILPLI